MKWSREARRTRAPPIVPRCSNASKPAFSVCAPKPVVTLFIPASGILGRIHDQRAMLAALYLLAAARDEETPNAISQEATAAEDFILV